MHALSQPSSLGLEPRSGTGIEALCDRKQLLWDWDTNTGCIKPKLGMQESDNFLKHQFKHCAQGEIGFFRQKLKKERNLLNSRSGSC